MSLEVAVTVFAVLGFYFGLVAWALLVLHRSVTCRHPRLDAIGGTVEGYGLLSCSDCHLVFIDYKSPGVKPRVGRI